MTSEDDPYYGIVPVGEEGATADSVSFTTEEIKKLQHNAYPWPHYKDQASQNNPMVRAKISHVPRECTTLPGKEPTATGWFIIENGRGNYANIPDDQPELLAKVIIAISGPQEQELFNLIREPSKAEHAKFMQRKRQARLKVKEHAEGKPSISLSDIGL